MGILKFINTITGKVVEEDITGCSCRSQYKRDKNCKSIDNLSVKELNDIIDSIKVKTITKTIAIDKEILEPIYEFN